MAPAPRYTAEPSDPGAYTATNDRLYSRFAGGYDLVVKLVPVWRGWLVRGAAGDPRPSGAGGLLRDRLAAHPLRRPSPRRRDRPESGPARHRPPEPRVAGLLTAAGLRVEDEEIGGWGSVHRYLATKPGAPEAS